MAAMPQVSHLAGNTFLQFWKDEKKGPSVCHTSRLSVFFFFPKVHPRAPRPPSHGLQPAASQAICPRGKGQGVGQ